MKNISRFIVSGMLLTALASVSCKKTTNSPTKTELITSSSWKFEKATAGGVDISNTPQLTCFKDNIIIFVSNGTGTINEGTNVCSPPAPATFTWSFQSNETALNLSTPLLPGGSSNFTIVTLNETNLVISQDVNLPPTTTIVVTLKH